MQFNSIEMNKTLGWVRKNMLGLIQLSNSVLNIEQTILLEKKTYLKSHPAVFICCLWQRCLKHPWKPKFYHKNDSLHTQKFQ